MRALGLAILVGALGTMGCASSTQVGRTAEGAPIVRIPLRLSNAYLVQSKTPVLVDAGTLGDLPDLENALAENGTLARHLGLVVVTHAHADHAGLAFDLHRISGARVVLGAGDVEQARRGHNDPLLPTGFTARLLEPFIPGNFPEFEPDLVVHDALDLAPWGIDGKVLPMPGHTRGSIVVVLANRSAFVGDLMLGGSFGGQISPGSPREHYFHADREQNRRNIKRLLDMGIETFYLGHGGPVARADVVAAFGG